MILSGERKLTPQQIQQRKKMLVYPLMGLVFLGSIYLIFAPSDKDEAKVENVGGFNADIPLPAGDGIIADKQKAYEQEQMKRSPMMIPVKKAIETICSASSLFPAPRERVI